MAPVFCLAAVEARLIPPRSSISSTRNSGMMAITISAMRHSMANITASAPTMVIMEITRSSGPWCASSVSSKRSVVSLLISWPVRLRS